MHSTVFYLVTILPIEQKVFFSYLLSRKFYNAALTRDHPSLLPSSRPDFEGRCGEVRTSPEIVLHLPWEFLHLP